MRDTAHTTAYVTPFFAVPTFITGLARILDFAGSMTQYNRIPHPLDADRIAIAADWAAVVADMRKVFEESRGTKESP